MKTLSNKRIVVRYPEGRSMGKTYSKIIYGYFEDDVKKAIKKLKETIVWSQTDNLGMITEEQINNIFGEELI